MSGISIGTSWVRIPNASGSTTTTVGFGEGGFGEGGFGGGTVTKQTGTQRPNWVAESTK